MMDKPRIAIPVPTSFDLAYNAKSWAQYAVAVEASGAVAVEVPLKLIPAQVERLLNSCQAVLLPGSGADLDPQKYGQRVTEACAAADPAREYIDELLLRDADNLHKPILGICFGHQSLNVWRGGSLVQDLTILPVNHAAGGGVAIAHSALVLTGSVIAGLLTAEEAPAKGEFLSLPVNSSHHQAVGHPGAGLRVTARCPQDGVIEAVEGEMSSSGSGQYVMGLQWHPERSYTISAASRAVFHRFVAEAGAWKQRLVHPLGS